jgi:hypothetical protein
MTTDTLVGTEDLQPATDPARSEVRLRMKPDDAAPGHVDGGWWPRSTDPAAEFPALVAALTSILGPISRAGYSLDAWNATARKLTVHDQVVRMEGFRTMQPNTVTLTGQNRRRISLLVVPPDTPGGVARAVLRSAADPDTTAAVQDILASNGVSLDQHQADTAEASRPRTADRTPEERWEAEGGHVSPSATHSEQKH